MSICYRHRQRIFTSVRVLTRKNEREKKLQKLTTVRPFARFQCRRPYCGTLYVTSRIFLIGSEFFRRKTMMNKNFLSFDSHRSKSTKPFSSDVGILSRFVCAVYPPPPPLRKYFRRICTLNGRLDYTRRSGRDVIHARPTHLLRYPFHVFPVPLSPPIDTRREPATGFTHGTFEAIREHTRFSRPEIRGPSKAHYSNEPRDLEKSRGNSIVDGGRKIRAAPPYEYVPAE